MMRTLAGWTFIVGMLVLVAFGAHAAPRILVVGDSWAAGIWATRAIDQVMLEYGITNVESVGDLTAVGGSTAAQWAKSDWLNVITYELLTHPTIDTVHLVIGGNDVLGRIKTTNVYSGLAQLMRNTWWNEIKTNVQKIVKHCLAHPQVKHVVIGGYDYLNRTTFQYFSAVLGQTVNFGGMSQTQVNSCFIDVGKKMLEIAMSTPNCYYVQNFGLLQWTFNIPAGAPKPGTFPLYVPWPGGNKAYPMPDAAFDTIWVGSFPFPGDGIHPNLNAHKTMLRNATDQFYRVWYGG